jgi:hypothetical protein
MLPKQKGKEQGGEDDSEEEGQISECISHSSMGLQCVDTLLDFMGQRGFEYSEIIATRKICTAVRRSLQNKQSLHTISQNKPQLCKNMKSNL